MNFEYIEPDLPEDYTFRISPSQISKFFDLPRIWYEDNFLGTESFKGNTASYLGTIIHAIAEAVAENRPTNSYIIEEYIDSIDNEDVDKTEIREHYKEMSHALINEYVLKNRPDETEYQTSALVLSGIYVAGTVDARLGYMIIDYKNVSKKPNIDSIPFAYKIQLMAYAFADRARGIFTDRIRIVYTVRRTKTLPVRVFSVTHQITEDDWKMIEDTLMLIALTVQKQRSNPELIPLLYKSMSLGK